MSKTYSLLFLLVRLGPATSVDPPFWTDTGTNVLTHLVSSIDYILVACPEEGDQRREEKQQPGSEVPINHTLDGGSFDYCLKQFEGLPTS